ncbi:FeoB-associated Cys-rich membrane protein [Dubosiella newyorkensis]|jgi:hypothetical protein|uniref:FeoB-associated Cys-rich membrane protein n=1 Tax=Dubosiella newyorkensis TaxID=1862672 RepID=A0A1U7NNP4_9FIRM|nr:FeoB-associated Cys-rich membrane protein [Dubosiella newyorkensis]MCI9041699.1 FeoB-associated Cys-rich membrane protein [Dubosiella newyorkensis]OLU46960.1 hypothetical protein BO225_04035 [Dubosiella newyorkensis]
MNIADVIVMIILSIVVILIIRVLKKPRSSCHGDCSSCGSSCSHIDWDAIRDDIHQEKKSR